MKKMIKTGFKLVICLVFLFSAYHLQAQVKKSELAPGGSVSTEIKSGEKHQYEVKLDGNRFAFFKLVQKGVDLIITTFDPDGKKLEEFDSPNGSEGPEFFSIISGKKGVYSFEVRPLNPGTEGKYDLRIEKNEPRATTPDGQVDQLFTAWDSRETPGAAVALVRDGRIIYKKGYGMANLEYDVPITPSTVFHIASVSKQFTAFAVLLLAKEGKLSLDDDVRKYIPEVPDFGKTITLRHLAHHTSGLRDQWNLLGMAGWRFDDVITKEHILKMVARQKELNFDPGEEYLYCNTGFTLLAEVVARVSGRSFAEFTEERIFKPLKMNNTLFYDDHEKIVKNRAYSYYGSGSGYKKSVLNYANVGATSLFTTVDDLSLWAMNFEKPVVGDAAMMDEMKKRGVLNNGNTIFYALGQGIGTYKGLDLISHSGGDAGYRTYLGRFPDQKFSVMVFSNDAAFNSGGMALKIADIYLKDEIAARQPPQEDAARKVPEQKKGVEVDPEILKSYAGNYELQPNFIITVTFENGQLFGQGSGQPRAALRALSADRFAVEGAPIEISFHKNEKNEVNLLKLYQGGNALEAPRVKPFDPKSVALSDFTGRFYSEELATEYTFVVENGKLTAKHPRVSDFDLTPVKKDFFSSRLGDIQFIRNESQQITGFRVSNGRVRNLWFAKVD
ncbi:MAG: serine hydrolase [Pyrinomonadaceae bacterium]